MNSEVEKRREQLVRQLDHVRLRLALKSEGYYANAAAYRYQQRRARELAAELEDELSALDCPGEYDELAVATVADELGLTCIQVRRLIESGEIEATGRPAHERIGRAELERIAALGAAGLLRLARQEADDIFAEAVPHLQRGDLELADRAYRRMRGHGGGWQPRMSAFLLCLEIAKGEFDSAWDSIRLIQECEDPFERAATVEYARRLLAEMSLVTNEAREFRKQLFIGIR
jgi:hypothetical protein